MSGLRKGFDAFGPASSYAALGLTLAVVLPAPLPTDLRVAVDHHSMASPPLGRRTGPLRSVPRPACRCLRCPTGADDNLVRLQVQLPHLLQRGDRVLRSALASAVRVSADAHGDASSTLRGDGQLLLQGSAAIRPFRAAPLPFHDAEHTRATGDADLRRKPTPVDCMRGAHAAAGWGMEDGM